MENSLGTKIEIGKYKKIVHQKRKYKKKWRLSNFIGTKTYLVNHYFGHQTCNALVNWTLILKNRQIGISI